jgi:hypothetical protein
MKINTFPKRNEHADVCINQCRVAWEWLNSISCLVAYDYCLGAASLCRNLFELVAGTVFLIEHPDKLQDFVDYGKMISYEVVKATMEDAQAGPMTPRQQVYLEALKRKTNYESVKQHFKHKNWYGGNIRKLTEAVGGKVVYRLLQGGICDCPRRRLHNAWVQSREMAVL